MSQNGSFPQVGVKKMKFEHYVSKNLVAQRSYKGMNIDSGGYLYCGLVAQYGNPINQRMTKKGWHRGFSSVLMFVC